MIQKRNNVLELEKQPQEAIAPRPVETIASPNAASQIVELKESAATTRACSFSAVQLSGTIKRKIVISTISKVLLNSAKEIMPNFSTKQIIEAALVNSISLASPEAFKTMQKELELNMGEIL